MDFFLYTACTLVACFLVFVVTRQWFVSEILEMQNFARAATYETAYTHPTAYMPVPPSGCALCRHSIETQAPDDPPGTAPVVMCLHKLTRKGSTHAPQACERAREPGERCGPEAALWDSRAEALERLRPTIEGLASVADPNGWHGVGPAPRWWYTATGRKVWRDEATRRGQA
jgi:hypothetical protein